MQTGDGCAALARTPQAVLAPGGRTRDGLRLMHPTLPFVLPLVSAFVYAFAALMLKRATERGIGPWRVSFVTNWIQCLFFLPFWLTGGASFAWPQLCHAMICGTTFFWGQVLTFLALTRGDVSVTTPVLGAKVIFVALLAVSLGVEPLTSQMWLAAVLTTIATALLGTGTPRRSRSLAPSVAFGFGAAFAFAVTDVLAQKWAPRWGFGHFAPAMFLTVAILSLGLIPFFRGNLRTLPWRWVAPGALAIAVQAGGIAYSIMVFGSATLTNIVYNSRGIWSVVLVWTIGPWFDNRERMHGTPVMMRRLAGATLLLLALVLVAR
jgi:drug/metabolite transporter (DMT)-like permease